MRVGVDGMSDIAICTIFKNESRYLYEWLSYHYYIGIRKFVLYNNGSTDDSIDVIRNWPHSDAIKIIDWPQVRGQIPAYLHMIQKNRDVAEWCAFIDCDEFITPITDLSIPEIFDRIPEPVAGIYAFWMMFGSSGHIARPEGLVTETYTRRAPDNFGSHNYGKSIVRLRRALQFTQRKEPALERFLQDVYTSRRHLQNQQRRVGQGLRVKRMPVRLSGRSVPPLQ